MGYKYTVFCYYMYNGHRAYCEIYAGNSLVKAIWHLLTSEPNYVRLEYRRDC